MTDRAWTNGAADRDLGTAGNWTGATAPVSNDRAFFTSDVTSANSSPNTGMADLTAVDLALLEIQDGYNQDIGSTGAPMDISAGIAHMFGAGTLYYKDGGGTTDFFLIDASRSRASGIKSLELSGTAVSNLANRRGWVDILASATVTTIANGHVGQATPDAKTTIGSGCSVTNIFAFGGIVECASTLVTGAHVHAGARYTQTTVVVPTLYVYPGAHVTLTVSGTYTTIYHYGGIIDGLQGSSKVVTNYYRLFKNEDEQNAFLGLRLGSTGIVTVTNALA